MVAVNDRKKCCYCGGCVSVCPKAAISMRETEIVVDAERCISCGMCAKVCPVGAMRVVK